MKPGTFDCAGTAACLRFPCAVFKPAFLSMPAGSLAGEVQRRQRPRPFSLFFVYDELLVPDPPDGARGHMWLLTAKRTPKAPLPLDTYDRKLSCASRQED